MSRRESKQSRDVDPDPIYGEKIVTKFINQLMRDGKKNTAEGILFDTFDAIEEKTDTEAIEVFENAIDNVKPSVEVRSRRVGGSTYQVPMEVEGARRAMLAMRWIIDAARNRHEYDMAERLTNELLDASNNRGGAVRRKEDMHRMAEANKAFAHYRW